MYSLRVLSKYGMPVFTNQNISNWASIIGSLFTIGPTIATCKCVNVCHHQLCNWDIHNLATFSMRKKSSAKYLIVLEMKGLKGGNILPFELKNVSPCRKWPLHTRVVSFKKLTRRVCVSFPFSAMCIWAIPFHFHDPICMWCMKGVIHFV